MTKVVTSIKIDDKILKESKKMAIDKGITFSNLLENALKRELEKR
jgi:antitoxin component of RelBE/YafQ-DinJ toxin-antitoxin module